MTSSEIGHGGYAMRNPNTGTIYLHAEYTVVEGRYARRKDVGKYRFT